LSHLLSGKTETSFRRFPGCPPEARSARSSALLFSVEVFPHFSAKRMTPEPASWLSFCVLHSDEALFLFPRPRTGKDSQKAPVYFSAAALSSRKRPAALH